MLFPAIGLRQIDDLTFRDLIPLVKKIAARGAVDAAKRLLPLLAQVFEYGIVSGVCDRNPARDVSTKSLGLPKVVKKNYAAIKDPAKLGDLLRATDEYNGILTVKVALQIAPHLGLRPTELAHGEWSEIDFQQAVWTIPAKRRKLATHVKRANLPEDAYVTPLTRQVLGMASPPSKCHRAREVFISILSGD